MGNYGFSYALESFCPIGNVIPDPEVLKELSSLPGNSDIILPWLYPHNCTLGSHPKLTGTDVLSQVERDYLNLIAFVYIFTQNFSLYRV